MSILLKMLGADTEEQGVETLTKFTSIMADLRVVTGTEGPTAALAVVQSHAGTVKQLEATFGKSGDELVSFLKDLDATAKAGAEASAALAATKATLDSVVAATGEASVDAALGSIATAKAARDELLPAAQAALAGVEQAKEKAEEEGLLKQLRDEIRITPAQEKDLWPSLSLEGKRAFAKTAPPINGAKPLVPESEGDATGANMTFEGKTYAELKPRERAALSSSNPALFKQLKAAHDSLNS